MPTALDSYRWLSEGALEMAGCLTAVASVDLERVAAAFGCDPEPAVPVVFAETPDHSGRASYGLEAWIGSSNDSAVVIEDNGFQGSRTEVLRSASKASATGLAASVFWNVNGLVMFSAARKGKVVCSVELLDADPSEFPRALRRLAALAGEDIDLVALGAAMVEQFTGVAFDRTVVDNAVHRPLTPVSEDWQTFGPESSTLQIYAPELVAAIVAADPSHHRPIASWAATAAAAEAGIADEKPVREMTARLLGPVPPTLPPTFGPLLGRWEREAHQWDNEHESYTLSASTGALEGSFLYSRIWAGRALQAAAHPDALEAALQATFDALWTFRCIRTDRGARFIEDETGRHWDHTDDGSRLPERAQAFADIVLQVIGRPDADGDALAAQLPRVLTSAEKVELVHADQELQASGAFDTWTRGEPIVTVIHGEVAPVVEWSTEKPDGG
jgi:hypothetical protein